ncbi:MAG: flagellin [Aestuariivirga sp.]|uniref:flagellin N-terminal helical domain-containing protein n=1 Tax=Aestuariivirga sp. TaxID=2650926 RepID=UPI0025BAC201|nr:flagellin [Aestuariivirga sp.]MCA3561406.1 flagellin [Aestuariivirga sp.]
MASIMTNASAMTALQSLNSTNKQLSITQARISTGFRVAAAEDNAAYWSIATTMRSDNGALSTVKDALGLGAATIDVAYTGTNKAIDVTKEIKNKLVAARQPGVDRAKVQSEIAELQNQLKSIAESSVFSGENWLSVDSSQATYNATKTIVASFSRAGGQVSIGTISLDITKTELIDANDQSGILDTQDTTANGNVNYSILSLDISVVTDTDNDLEDLEQMISFVDGGIGKMTTAASSLGAVKQRTNMQKDFVNSLMDAITSGIGTLVDADMNEESTRLQALQVQQQLGVQSLSIANQNSQQILSLFRG